MVLESVVLLLGFFMGVSVRRERVGRAGFLDFSLNRLRGKSWNFSLNRGRAGISVLLRLCEGVLTRAGRFRSAAGHISGGGSSGPVICVVLLGISGGGGLLTPQPVCVLLLGFFGGGFGPRVSVARILLCCCWDLAGVSVKGEPGDIQPLIPHGGIGLPARADPGLPSCAIA